MGLGTSLLLIAIGAVLRFAVTVTTSGVNLHTVGVILMIIGGVGLIVSLLWMTVLADRRRDTLVTREGVPPVRDVDPRY